MSPLDFIVIDDELLLQNLDRVQTVRSFLFSQHDLAEVSFPKDCEEVEVIESNLPLLCYRSRGVLLHLLL